MRWTYVDADGCHPGLVVLHEDELDGVKGFAPEMVVVACPRTESVICGWHLEDGTFLGMARGGEC